MEQEVIATQNRPSESRPGNAPPWLPYVAPMAAFIVLTQLEALLPKPLYPAVYAVKVALVTAVLIRYSRAWRGEIVPEARWSIPAIVVGLLTFGEWVLLDRWIPYPHLGARVGLNPAEAIADPVARTLFVATRLYGLAVMVPVMEEVFWRSFLLRFVTNQERWQSLPIGSFSAAAFFVVSALFASIHSEWLVAFICGMLFAGLLWWSKSLFAVIVAHAVANLALGIYVLTTGDWKYW